jgi:hypothetical protein
MAQSGMAPSDSEAVITTPVAVILVTPVDEVMNGGGLTYFVSPATIADLGGTVVSPAA